MNDKSKLLIKVIKLLASNSNVQRDYLRKIGTFPSADELALEFDDAYRPFIGQIDSDFPSSILIGLNQINSLFDLYSDMKDKTIWSEASLDTNLWLEVRDIANSILKKIPAQAHL